MLLSSVASSVVLSGFLVRRGIRALVALRDNLALLVKVLESREQTQAPPLVVNVQDAKRQGTALFEEGSIGRIGVGRMEIPLDSLIHVDEDPIVRLPQDHAGNVFTGRILLFHRLPRVVLHPLEAEGDPVLLAVNGEHVHGDTLTRRQHVDGWLT